MGSISMLMEFIVATRSPLMLVEWRFWEIDVMFPFGNVRKLRTYSCNTKIDLWEHYANLYKVNLILKNGQKVTKGQEQNKGS